MSAHPIPLAALDDRLGFVGTAGSGKTYNAGSAIERVLGSGNFNNLRGSLKSVGLFDYPSPGLIRAADWLFP